MYQMSPLNWLNLMIFFISMLIMMNIKNYFMYIMNLKKMEWKNNKMTNWKW